MCFQQALLFYFIIIIILVLIHARCFNKTKEQIVINIVVVIVVVIKHSTKSRFNRVFIERARALPRFFRRRVAKYFRNLSFVLIVPEVDVDVVVASNQKKKPVNTQNFTLARKKGARAGRGGAGRAVKFLGMYANLLFASGNGHKRAG